MAKLEIRITHPAISGFLGYMDPDTQQGSEENMARKYAKQLPDECDRMLSELPSFLQLAEFPLQEIQNVYWRNLNSSDEAKSWLMLMAEILREERAKALKNSPGV